MNIIRHVGSHKKLISPERPNQGTQRKKKTKKKHTETFIKCSKPNDKVSSNRDNAKVPVNINPVTKIPKDHGQKQEFI